MNNHVKRYTGQEGTMGDGRQLPCPLQSYHLPASQYIHQPGLPPNLKVEEFLWKLCYIGIIE